MPVSSIVSTLYSAFPDATTVSNILIATLRARRYARMHPSASFAVVLRKSGLVRVECVASRRRSGYKSHGIYVACVHGANSARVMH